MTIGIIGGTGPAGSGLALRLADAGHDVLLGSRDSAKAEQRVSELHDQWGSRVATLHGGSNDDAAHTDVVVLATVADSIVTTAHDHAAALDGRVVVSMGNLLVRNERGFAAVLPEGGSLAVSVQHAAPGARVVGAFQNLPAKALSQLDQGLDADVIVCGDDAGAVGQIIELTATITGLHPADGGPLVNAASIEALTAVLLTVNRVRRGEHGIRLVDLRAKLASEPS